MGEIQIYDKNSIEHIKLEMFARIMDSKTPSNYYFTVDDGFFDCGQGWKWTSVSSHSKVDEMRGSVLGSWWTLNPKQYETILDSNSFDELVNIADEILQRDKGLRVPIYEEKNYRDEAFKSLVMAGHEDKNDESLENDDIDIEL